MSLRLALAKSINAQGQVKETANASFDRFHPALGRTKTGAGESVDFQMLAAPLAHPSRLAASLAK
jgi:hypothetical protein